MTYPGTPRSVVFTFICCCVLCPASGNARANKHYCEFSEGSTKHERCFRTVLSANECFGPGTGKTYAYHDRKKKLGGVRLSAGDYKKLRASTGSDQKTMLVYIYVLTHLRGHVVLRRPAAKRARIERRLAMGYSHGSYLADRRRVKKIIRGREAFTDCYAGFEMARALTSVRCLSDLERTFTAIQLGPLLDSAGGVFGKHLGRGITRGQRLANYAWGFAAGRHLLDRNLSHQYRLRAEGLCYRAAGQMLRRSKKSLGVFKVKR